MAGVRGGDSGGTGMRIGELGTSGERANLGEQTARQNLTKKTGGNNRRKEEKKVVRVESRWIVLAPKASKTLGPKRDLRKRGENYRQGDFRKRGIEGGAKSMTIENWTEL